MLQGATYNVIVTLDIDKPYDEVIFYLENEKQNVKEEFVFTESSVDNLFIIPLTQEKTIKLVGRNKIRAQINYSDKSVSKSNKGSFVIYKSDNTKIIENNKPALDQQGDIDVILEVIKGEAVLVISPEQTRELIERITQLFADTEQIAQSVRDDADAGKFDGEPGPQGPPGPAGSYTAGYGIKIDGETISIDLPEAESEEY